MFDLSFEEQFLVEETRFPAAAATVLLIGAAGPIPPLRKRVAALRHCAKHRPRPFRAASRLNTLLIAHALASRTR
jgi:hypothetical protein